jgi:hypothetical protein
MIARVVASRVENIELVVVNRIVEIVEEKIVEDKIVEIVVNSRVEIVEGGRVVERVAERVVVENKDWKVDIESRVVENIEKDMETFGVEARLDRYFVVLGCIVG